MRLMIIAALMLGTALSATAAIADPAWQLFGGWEQTTLYVLPPRHEADPKMRLSWMKVEWPKLQLEGSFPFQTMVSLDEVNCATGQFRGIQSTLYEGPGIKGDSHQERDEPGSWSYPVPGSVAEAQLKFACGR